jgi:Zn-dependent protease
MTNVPVRILQFVLLVVPAIILHEVAHGYVAYLLGDPTAKDRGRLTLNPIPHIDIIGTVVLPLVMLVTTGFAFGWAKPVPINPYRMTKTSPETGMLLTGAAGPTTNILLAVLFAGVYRLLALFNGMTPDNPPVSFFVMSLVSFFVLINLILAFFNLIPIPPLDGSRVVQRFLSGRAREWYGSIEPYGFMIVILLGFVVPSYLGINLFGAYLDATAYRLASFLTGVGMF